jgi:hypothetical protein
LVATSGFQGSEALQILVPVCSCAALMLHLNQADRAGNAGAGGCWYELFGASCCAGCAVSHRSFSCWVPGEDKM